jgi:HD superfamily phosphodiesterase
MKLIDKLLKYVLITTKKYNIDESHGMKHSMEVLNFAHKIYESEINKGNDLEKYKKIIYTSAIIHDMCDKKYVDQNTGLNDINSFLMDKVSFNEITMIDQIISTMSYSYVKKNGFPDFGEHQLVYHIVREADLLAAYDFDRCLIYNIHKLDGNVTNAFLDAKELFEKRVFKHNSDKLFITDFSKEESLILHETAVERMKIWSSLMEDKSIL